MTKLLLVGCGKMGGALLAGWLEQGIDAADVIIVDPQPADRSALPTSLRIVDRDSDLPDDSTPDVILLAVKPQVMDQVVPPYARFGKSLFISIAAGRSLESLTRLLGSEVALIRAMPNIPAAVRRGVTVLLANAEVTADQRSLCQSLMAAVGDVAWLENEADMAAVTALSGSGPAYVFALVEAMATAGEHLGLMPELAQVLARATVVGSGELLRKSPETAAKLRENVTSPNGTTYAALQILLGPTGLTELMSRALAAAAQRARDLAG